MKLTQELIALGTKTQVKEGHLNLSSAIKIENDFNTTRFNVKYHDRLLGFVWRCDDGSWCAKDKKTEREWDSLDDRAEAIKRILDMNNLQDMYATRHLPESVISEEATDKLLAYFRDGLKSAIGENGSTHLSPESRETINNMFKRFHKYLMKGDMRGFRLAYRDESEKNPDEFDIYMDEVFAAAGVNDIDALLKRASVTESAIAKAKGIFEPVMENRRTADQLNIGDFVEITGDVKFHGRIGEIVNFGIDKKFVIVHLHGLSGTYSFHSSDVSEANPEDIDIDDEIEDDDEPELNKFYVAFYNTREDRAWIGLVTKEGGGKWREEPYKGTPDYRWGDKSYMSYLTPDDIMSWIRDDFQRGNEIEGPFDNAQDAEKFVTRHFGKLEESVNESAHIMYDKGYRDAKNNRPSIVKTLTGNDRHNYKRGYADGLADREKVTEVVDAKNWKPGDKIPRGYEMTAHGRLVKKAKGAGKANQGVGGFSYGVKTPRKGTLAAEIAARRKKEDAMLGNFEIKDDMVGIAKRVKESTVNEGVRLMKTVVRDNRTAKVYKDGDLGEFRVKFFVDGKHQGEDSDYFTKDYEDAMSTAQSWAEKKITEQEMLARMLKHVNDKRDFHNPVRAITKKAIKDTRAFTRGVQGAFDGEKFKSDQTHLKALRARGVATSALERRLDSKFIADRKAAASSKSAAAKLAKKDVPGIYKEFSLGKKTTKGTGHARNEKAGYIDDGDDGDDGGIGEAAQLMFGKSFHDLSAIDAAAIIDFKKANLIAESMFGKSRFWTLSHDQMVELVKTNPDVFTESAKNEKEAHRRKVLNTINHFSDFLHHMAEEELVACKVHEVVPYGHVTDAAKYSTSKPIDVAFIVDCQDTPRQKGLQKDLTDKLQKRLEKHPLPGIGIIKAHVFHQDADGFELGESVVNKANKSWKDFEDWKQAVLNAYPDKAKKIRFHGRVEGGKLIVSAEIPGLDRSFGVFDFDEKKGYVLGESGRNHQQ